MILNLASGDPCYVPDPWIGHPQDQVEALAIPLLQCCLLEPIHWRVAAFLASHSGWHAPGDIAAALAQDPRSVVRALLALGGSRLVQERVLATGPLFCLAEGAALRRVTLRFEPQPEPCLPTPDWHAGSASFR